MMFASALSHLSPSWVDQNSWAWNPLEPFTHVSGAQTGVTRGSGLAGAIGWGNWGPGRLDV